MHKHYYLLSTILFGTLPEKHCMIETRFYGGESCTSERLKAVELLPNFVDKREDCMSVTALMQWKVLRMMLHQSYTAAGFMPNIMDKI